MREEHQTREPATAIASLEIAQAVREALLDKMDQHGDAWDAGILLHEMFRMVGRLARSCDMPPLQLEVQIDFLTQVYAGLASGSTPPVAEVLQQLFPESNSQGLPGDDQTESKVLQ